MPPPKIAISVGTWFARNKLLTGSTIIILITALLFAGSYIHIQTLQSKIQTQNQTIQTLSTDIVKQNEAIRNLQQRQQQELEQSRDRVREELERQERIKEERTSINTAEELNQWLDNL